MFILFSLNGTYGDGRSGTFPTWKVNPNIGEKLNIVFEKMDIDISIGGHWDNQNKQELINSIRQDY